MNRRTLLGAGARVLGATTALSWLGPARLYAATDERPRFLLVFLRGAYDALSVLVPTSSTYYYENRRHIAIAQPSEAGGALALDAHWALHPALRESIAPLALAGQAAFVPFAGSDDISRSHFETQDTLELGQPLGGRRDFQSGFMNRLAVALGAQDSIAFTEQLPLSMRGTASIANVSLKAAARAAMDAPTRALLTRMYSHSPLAAPVAEGFDVRDEVARDTAASSADTTAPNAIGEMASANRRAVSAQGFEIEARRIARLMRERYALAAVDIGGWDTHVNQGDATGYLATRLGELGRGLAGYADELGVPAWRNTVVVVISEFGRTVRENGNRGTDHGHGSVYWVLGGGLRGPVIAGEQVAVEARTLFQDRDLPVLTDYRALLGGLLRRQYGLSDDALSAVFPGARAADLRLL